MVLGTDATGVAVFFGVAKSCGAVPADWMTLTDAGVAALEVVTGNGAGETGPVVWRTGWGQNSQAPASSTRHIKIQKDERERIFFTLNRKLNRQGAQIAKKQNHDGDRLALNR